MGLSNFIGLYFFDVLESGDFIKYSKISKSMHSFSCKKYLLFTLENFKCILCDTLFEYNSQIIIPMVNFVNIEDLKFKMKILSALKWT